MLLAHKESEVQIEEDSNMSSWRQRLCGTTIAKNHDESDEFYSLDQVLRSNESLSHGGGALGQNQANLKTAHQVILPTENYAVLILKRDGQAVIYSEDEAITKTQDEFLEEEHESFSFVFKN